LHRDGVVMMRQTSTKNNLIIYRSKHHEHNYVIILPTKLSVDNRKMRSRWMNDRIFLLKKQDANSFPG
jgi:hypothetical protein